MCVGTTRVDDAVPEAADDSVVCSGELESTVEPGRELTPVDE